MGHRVKLPNLHHEMTISSSYRFCHFGGLKHRTTAKHELGCLLNGSRKMLDSRVRRVLEGRAVEVLEGRVSFPIRILTRLSGNCGAGLSGISSA